MLKKNLDEMMYLSGQQSAIDELENVQTDHEFSARYQQKKKALLDSILPEENRVTEETEEGYPVKNEKQNNRRKRRWSKGVAAAVMFLVIGSLSITTYATAKYILTDKESRGNVLTVGMSNGETDDSKDEELEVPELNYSFGYVPEGYSEWEPRKFSKNGEWAGDGFYVTQWQGNDTTFEYLEKRTETTINGKQAYCYELGEENRLFRNVIQIMYNDSGAMYELRSETDDITMEELLKIAENMTVTESGENLTIYAQDKKGSDEPLTYLDVPADHILSAGEKVVDASVDEGMEVTLNKLEVTDDIAGMDKQYFFDYDGEIAPFINENSKFVDFTGKYDEHNENGVSELQEKNQFKVVRATFTVTNTSDELQEFAVNNANLCYLEMNSSGNYSYEQGIDRINGRYKNEDIASQEPVYFNKPQYTSDSERHHFYFVDVAAGETLEYEIAFIVHEDSMDDLYLSFGQSGGMIKSNYENGRGNNLKPQVWFWKVQ